MQQDGQIDRSDLTIEVPAAAAGVITSGAKDSLRTHGWKLMVGGAQVQITGRADEQVATTASATPARYLLAIKGRRRDVCLLPPEPLVEATIAIVDRKTHTEVLTFRSTNCASKIAEQFDAELGRVMAR